MNQISGLEKESLNFYKNQLKFWNNDKQLAYYFFEHRNLSEGVKSRIKLTYMQFMQKYKIFTIDNLRNYFTNIDTTNWMTRTSNIKLGKNEKTIRMITFWAKQDIPKIKFSSTKLGRENNVSVINKDQYLNAENLLYVKGEFEDALLIHIMWSLASRPSEMLTLRFEEIKI